MTKPILRVNKEVLIPSLVSVKAELDMGWALADFALSFLLSGEERLTERMKKEENSGSGSLNGLVHVRQQ